MSEVAQHLAEIRKSLPDHVTLLAVSKRQPLEKLHEAYAAGQRDFGENKVQELMEKVDQLPADIRWHLIGHLQTNKVKYIAPFVHLIHSVDSLKLLQEIEKRAAQNNRTIPVLLQMHIAEEESKFGLNAEELTELAEAALSGHFPHIELRGLMGMATFTEDEAQVRKEFGVLKGHFDHWKTHFPSFNTLSMGMSGDLEIAIEQGSTLVRVGTAIFGERNY